MAERYDNQRKIFEFLKARLESMLPFSKEDLQAVTQWHGATFDTYWTKQFRPLVIDLGEGRYRVSEVFRRYATWSRFRQHVTQVRPAAANYSPSQYDKVLVYEFFMPLTNEEYLRSTLDALFYRDTVQARLSTIPDDIRRRHFVALIGEDIDHHVTRLCDWISSKFVGYSVYHVSGRFRTDDLLTRTDAAESPRYIIDETTAVTRFIFPCESQDEAQQIAFFFHELFVKAILEVVNGEDEIWMMETELGNRLHIWRVNAGG